MKVKSYWKIALGGGGLTNLPINLAGKLTTGYINIKASCTGFSTLKRKASI